MGTYVDINVDIEEYLNDFDSDTLMLELVDRGFKVYKPGWSLTGDTLRRYLCDTIGLSYHVKNDELFKKLSETF